MKTLLGLPLLVLFLGIVGLAMLVPAGVGAVLEDHETARPFFYGGVLTVIVATLLGFATASRARRRAAREQLLALVLTLTALPLVLAVPFSEAVPGTRFLDVYVEMVSCLTTTGATLFAPADLPFAVHLWRAEVAWLGGFLMWVAAFGVLAPMALGGFEVTSSLEAGRGEGRRDLRDDSFGPGRMWKHASRLAPVYAGFTLVLWIGLVALGDPPGEAAIRAMSVISTSGITSQGGEALPSGRWGEMLILLFLLPALTRRVFENGWSFPAPRALQADRELRAATVVVVGLTSFLFLRHWLGAWETAQDLDARAVPAIWGNLFTLTSFLSTTGFVSSDWQAAQAWSGLGTPGLLLAGMAIFGGGVATTAGGVKLLRVYALYKHGLREMERLVHPHSVGGQGTTARRIRREGAAVAWVFFMLFAMSIAVVMTALSATGLEFESTVILAVAALSTTGPVASVAGDAAISYGLLSDAAKLILAAAMTLGRLETLAIIALLNPDFWRA
jgi:trk system potassium uptake protein TrkH